MPLLSVRVEVKRQEGIKFSGKECCAHTVPDAGREHLSLYVAVLNLMTRYLENGLLSIHGAV